MLQIHIYRVLFLFYNHYNYKHNHYNMYYSSVSLPVRVLIALALLVFVCSALMMNTNTNTIEYFHIEYTDPTSVLLLSNRVDLGTYFIVGAVFIAIVVCMYV